MSASSTRRRTSTQSKRPDVEAWLEANGVEFVHEANIALDEFDFDKSLHNQARFEPLDPDTVEEYATAMRRGDIFPAVVAYKPTARGKLVIVDGNHRLHARQRADLPGIDVYTITKAKPQVIAKLSFQANTRHGKPTSFDERVNQAVWLYDNGMSYGEAADTVNLKESDVSKAVLRLQADRRADEVGITRKEWDMITQSAKNRLNAVLTDEGFRAAAVLTARAQLDAQEVFELVGEINKVRSSSRQVGICKQWETAYSERIQDAASGALTVTNRRQATPKVTLGRVLSGIATLPDDLSLIADRYIGDERAEAAKRLHDAAGRLTSLAERLESEMVPS